MTVYVRHLKLHILSCIVPLTLLYCFTTVYTDTITHCHCTLSLLHWYLCDEMCHMYVRMLLPSAVLGTQGGADYKLPIIINKVLPDSAVSV